MSTPKKNVAYTFYTSLIDSATGDFKANPTIATGDFKVSIDGGTFTNLTTLPVVDPSGSIGVKIDLSADEMNGNKLMVQGIDVAGDEWSDILVFLDVTTTTIDDIKSDTAELVNIGEGNWSISGTQMIFYNTVGVEILRYNLKDSGGLPNSREVFSREKV